MNAVRVMLDHGADVNAFDPLGRTPLMYAAGSDTLALDVVKLLVARGANVSASVWVDSSSLERQGEWRSPLSMARKGKHASVVAFLLAAGARE